MGVNLGVAYHRMGRLEDAEAHYRAAIDLCRETGALRTMSLTLGNLANVARVLIKSNQATFLSDFCKERVSIIE